MISYLIELGKKDYCQSILSDVDHVPVLEVDIDLSMVKEKPLGVTLFGRCKFCIERLLVFNNYAEINEIMYIC